MRRILGGFGAIAGVTYPLRALRLLWDAPTLWSYTIAPISINLVLGGGLYWWLWPVGQRLVRAIATRTAAAIDRLPGWLGFLERAAVAISWLLQGLLVLGILAIVGLVLVQFGTLVGAPFYGKLSEQVERRHTGNLVVVEVGAIRDIIRAILFELKKLAIALPLGLLLLAVNILPGLGTAVASVGWIALSALLVGLDFFDGVLERRRLRFRQKLAMAFRALPASGSFSLTCLVLVGIPIVNFVTIPLCVVAGTLFACDRIVPKLPGEPTRSYPNRRQ